MTNRIVNWHTEHRKHETFGERAADKLRNGMGSWSFVIAFLAVMAVWITINSRTGAWDPYPFILLNLGLSMIAGLQGAILLIAAKRQDQISAALAQHDYDTNVESKRDVETLIALAQSQQAAMEALMARLDAGASSPAGGSKD